MIACNAHNIDAVRDALGCSLTEASKLLKGYRDEREKLRDEFAAKALSILADSDYYGDAMNTARFAYGIADAMLDEREK